MVEEAGELIRLTNKKYTSNIHSEGGREVRNARNTEQRGINEIKGNTKYSRIYDADYRKEFKAEAVCGKTLRTPA